MANRSGIQLVCFDLGRVLIRICDGWRHACEVAGIEVPAGLAELSAAQMVEIDEIVGRYDSGVIDTAAFAQEIAPYRGLRAQDVIRVQEVYLRGPYPGTTQLIDDLVRAGCKTACLSNTTDNHWRMMLDASGPNYLPLERLTWRFASHLIGAMKPHDEIYEHVERESGVSPASILFFDDLEANVAAAAGRGWNAHRIRTDNDPIAQARTVLRDRGVL